MVLHHITQRSGFFIITTTSTFHPQIFRAGYLDVADVFAVPQRLKNRIGETQHHQVLRGFFSEIMIDPIRIRFVKRLVHNLVQMLCRF